MFGLDIRNRYFTIFDELRVELGDADNMDQGSAG
jgi:hypothetical protein